MVFVILFLPSNPPNTEPLDLATEWDLINNRVRYLTGKNIFKIEPFPVNISKSRLVTTLVDYNPQILHFSGHGSTGGGLILTHESGEPEVASKNDLEDIFKVLSKYIFLVFLNACYSEDQAMIISQYVKCVIGMSTKVYNETAREFSSQFYALFATGKSIQESFDLAVAHIKSISRKDSEVPILIPKDGINPAKLSLKSIGLNNTSLNSTSNKICDSLPIIKENYLKFLANKIVAEEFFNIISCPLSRFIFDFENTKKFGQNKIDILLTLYSSLSTQIEQINSNKIIGNFDVANVASIRTKKTVGNIIQELERIC